MNTKESKKPTADELAGVPVTHEETPPWVRKTRVRSRKTHFLPVIGGKTPTADDLAGVPFCVVAKADCTVRPRRRS
jgi:hypothetical protein